MRFLKLIRSRLDDDRVYRSFGASRSVFLFLLLIRVVPGTAGNALRFELCTGFLGGVWEVFYNSSVSPLGYIYKGDW